MDGLFQLIMMIMVHLLPSIQTKTTSGVFNNE
jgi:hypothetical protein